MKLSEAILAVSAECDREVDQARSGDPVFDRMMRVTIGEEYKELDKVLPTYVAEIASAKGVPGGTYLPEYVYQIARMCFRMGMRTQRKLDQPDKVTTSFWQTGVPQ